MNYKIFNVPIPHSETEIASLNSFINTVKVVSCIKELVIVEKTAYQSFVVEYYKYQNSVTNGQKKDSIDYREVLSDEDFASFSKLRELRKKIAEKTGVPVFAVFTNEQLSQMVLKKMYTLLWLSYKTNRYIFATKNKIAFQKKCK